MLSVLKAGPLYIHAAAAGFVNVMTLLLEASANPMLKDDAGETALYLARRASKSDALELLIQREA